MSWCLVIPRLALNIYVAKFDVNITRNLHRNELRSFVWRRLNTSNFTGSMNRISELTSTIELKEESHVLNVKQRIHNIK